MAVLTEGGVAPARTLEAIREDLLVLEDDLTQHYLLALGTGDKPGMAEIVDAALDLHAAACKLAAFVCPAVS